MKYIISLVSAILFSLTWVKAATVIHIINSNTSVYEFEETDPEYTYTSVYDKKNKLIIGLYSDDYLFPFVSISIAAPIGEILRTGSFYTKLYLFNFSSTEPQFEWSILDRDSISMNESNNHSWFSVLEIGGIKGETFSQLALDAYDGNGGFVSVRHNSSIPLTTNIPEPGVTLISTLSLLLLFKRLRRLL